MGRHKTMTAEDKQQYCRDYYHRTKSERAHEYSLVAKRAYLRKQLKETGLLSNPDKSKMIQDKIDAITKELDGIRDARWQQKRAEGKALFKKFKEDDNSNETINATTITIQ